MFIVFSLFFFFIIGLPVSFGIGAVIGYFIWLIYRKKQLKKAKFYVLWGGVLYIVSQPISLIFVVFLPIRKIDHLLGYSIPIEGISLCEMVFAVLFALTFTAGILYLMAKKQVKSSKPFFEGIYLH